MLMTQSFHSSIYSFIHSFVHLCCCFTLTARKSPFGCHISEHSVTLNRFFCLKSLRLGIATRLTRAGEFPSSRAQNASVLSLGLHSKSATPFLLAAAAEEESRERETVVSTVAHQSVDTLKHCKILVSQRYHTPLRIKNSMRKRNSISQKDRHEST